MSLLQGMLPLVAQDNGRSRLAWRSLSTAWLESGWALSE